MNTMGSAAITAAEYVMPTGRLGLKGPVVKPAPGTLPLRGDLAHIALAETHLAAHYVIPLVQIVGEEGASMRLMPRDDSEIMHVISAGTALEILDEAGDWVWATIGPDGPSGYVELDALA
ncbi:MAG: SH3 domain-containing protein [Pseudomonadota bacterium]